MRVVFNKSSGNFLVSIGGTEFEVKTIIRLGRGKKDQPGVPRCLEMGGYLFLLEISPQLDKALENHGGRPGLTDAVLQADSCPGREDLAGFESREIWFTDTYEVMTNPEYV